MKRAGDAERQFALGFSGDHRFDPAGKHQIFRSDDMLGDGGRILLTKGHGVMIEVPYAKLSRVALQDLHVDGEPVVRVRRKLDGTIVGEWLTGATERPAGSPPDSAPSRASEGQARATGGAEKAIIGALRLAGTLLGQSSSDGLRSLGSLLSSVTQQTGGTAEPTAARAVPTSRAPANEPAPSACTPGTAGGPGAAGPAATPATSRAHRPAAVTPEPTAIPSTRTCEQCANFRPYARTWERFAEELAPSAGESEVSQGLDQLRNMEEKGKGEEARHLADLYRRGGDRWTNRPSFFSYCAAHERDPEEPSCFIAQIRNADQRCRPVRRVSGQRWNDAPTDFVPKEPRAHSCKTCTHRVKAAGPGEDAAELRELVSEAIKADLLAGAHTSGRGSSIASSYADNKRKNASAARAREMTQAFASRAMDSHAPVEPRYVDRCGLKSDPSRNRYRVCAVENANDSCPDWESA